MPSSARALFGRPAVSISGAILRKAEGFVLRLRVGSHVIALREDANDPRILRGWAEALSALGREDDDQTRWRHADALERRHAAFAHGKPATQGRRVSG